MADGATEFTPPLPVCVMRVLARAQLAYLATCEECGGDVSPHLSLMRFTWLSDGAPAGGLLVMTTRRDTKKFAALTANPRVAVLLHDFEGLRGGEGAASCEPGSVSVTVYGTARVVEGEEGERLRAAHLAANPTYPQFVTGPGIAVLAIAPHLARYCDIGDRVTVWEGGAAAAAQASSSAGSPRDGGAAATAAAGSGPASDAASS